MNKLQPGRMLADLLATVPELRTFANLDVHVLFNKDSCRIGPAEWIHMAKTLHSAREHFDAFVIVHGTDTMSYTASALSLLLAGFRKPIILTGSQARVHTRCSAAAAQRRRSGGAATGGAGEGSLALILFCFFCWRWKAAPGLCLTTDAQPASAPTHSPL